MIREFSGRYAALSNFSEHPVSWLGETWPTVEHAFAASKTTDLEARARIQAAATPGQAKRFGRRVDLRADWEDVKVWTMEALVYVKLVAHDKVRELLLSTEEEQLIEGNTWGDRFWGAVRDETVRSGERIWELGGQVVFAGRTQQLPHLTGQNQLGLILMRLRDEFRAADEIMRTRADRRMVETLLSFDSRAA